MNILTSASDPFVAKAVKAEMVTDQAERAEAQAEKEKRLKHLEDNIIG